MIRKALDGQITVTLSELAGMTGLSGMTLRRLARSEGLPAYRVGGSVVVIVEEFLTWVRSRPAYGKATTGTERADENIERAFSRAQKE